MWDGIGRMVTACRIRILTAGRPTTGTNNRRHPWQKISIGKAYKKGSRPWKLRRPIYCIRKQVKDKASGGETALALASLRAQRRDLEAIAHEYAASQQPQPD